MRTRICLWILLLSCVKSGAESRWIRIRSENFEIYSTAGEGSTRDAVRRFEQVRAFFLQSAAREDQKSEPVRIIAFNSQKEFEPYRPNEFAAAYYFPGVAGDTIVMSHLGAETYPMAVHEYVHLVIQHLALQFPLWLNEGMAECTPRCGKPETRPWSAI